MRAAAITKIGIECPFETEGIIGKFIICFFDSKQEQLELLRNSINEMIKNRASTDERFIVVFTFNPLDGVIPYETGYYFGNNTVDAQ